MSKKKVTTTTTVTTVTETIPTGNLETLVSIVVDESSSMGGSQNSVISGINEYVAGLKAKDSDTNHYFITLTKFANESTVVFKNKPISEWVPLTAETYSPNGMTALNDAIGDTIQANESYMKLHANAAVLMLIMTDGGENASKRFTTTALKELIASKEAASEWTFVYLGAGQDSFTTAAAYGIRGGNTLNFSISNTPQMMRAMTSATLNYANQRNSVGTVKGIAVMDGLNATDVLNESDAKLYSNPSTVTAPDATDSGN